MSTKLSQIQVLFQTRNARQRGPTSSDQFNDMVAEIAHDLSTLNDQWNNRLIPLITPVPDGTSDVSIDAYANGLDGANLLVKQDASNTTYSTYYNSASTRPNSVYEQFAEVYSNINVIRDDLEYQITNITSSASQLSIADSASLYDSTNVEDALAEVMLTANSAAASAINNLQEAFDGGQSITVSDGDDQTLTFNQNDVTNNPNAVVINNTGTGINLLLSSSSDSATKLSMTNTDSGHTFQAMVTGTAASIGADKFSIYDNIAAAHRLVIDSSGQVGINNSAPGAALDVVGNIEIEDTTASTEGVVLKSGTRFLHNFHHATGGGGLPEGHNVFLGESAGNFTMGSTATETYHSSNNIGIGDSPLDALTLGFRNVGIGTNALSSCTEGNYNIGIGYSAGQNITTGVYNVAIGERCLEGGIVASGNVGVGYCALLVAGANYNTAIGNNALPSIMDGANNIAIGAAAGQSESDGTDNESVDNCIFIGYDTRPDVSGDINEIVIGHETMGQGSNTVTIGNLSTTDLYLDGNVTCSGVDISDTLGSGEGVVSKDGTRFLHNFHHPTGSSAIPEGGNIFLGEDAGNFTMGSTATNIVHGSHNIGIGSNVLDATTTGYRNIGIGYDSLTEVTTGNENVAIGDGTLAAVDTSDYGTAIGSSSQRYTTGGSNSSVGWGSLGNLTSGSYNIAIGRSAGRNYGGASALQTPSNSVFIGYNTKASGDGNSNEVVIGDQAVGNGTNTVTIGNSSIVNNHLTGNITVEDTTASDEGVILKGSTRFLHNYHDSVGGGAVPDGRNIFLGELAGNFTVGSTASNTYEASDNIGIGNVSLDGVTTGFRNVGVGSSSLTTLTSGSYNTAIGYYALASTTGAGFNTGIGANALSVVTGSSNTGIGYAALNDLTTGASNIGIGVSAGEKITGGSTSNQTSGTSIYIGNSTRASADGNVNEIIIGDQVTGNGSNTATIGNTDTTDIYLDGDVICSGLDISDTTASTEGIISKDGTRFLHNFHHPTGSSAIPLGKNIFLGESAGNFTIGSTATGTFQGSYNIGIGSIALDSLTTGYRNIGIGHQSTASVTTGFENIGIGYNTLVLADTTSYSVAIGSNSQTYATAGNNTSVGSTALNGLTTGDFNIAFGVSAGRKITGGSTDNQTSTNSIYIGYSTRASADGNTNEIVIGDQVTGNGSNTVTIGNDSTTDLYFNGDVTCSGVEANGDISVRYGDKLIFDGAGGDDYFYSDSASTITAVVGASPAFRISGSTVQAVNSDLLLTSASKRFYNSNGVLNIGTSASTNHGITTGDVLFGGKAEFDDDVYMDADLEVSGVVSVNGQISSLVPTTLIPTGTTQTIDWNDGNMQVIDLDSATGDVTLTLSNPASGASYIIKTIQGGTARDLVFPASVLHQEGVTPTLSTAEDAIDVITMAYDGTNYLANTGKNYS